MLAITSLSSDCHSDCCIGRKEITQIPPSQRNHSSSIVMKISSGLGLIVLSSLFLPVLCREKGAQHGDSSSIMLEDFSNPKHDWREMNDPVMGGRSRGSFNVKDGVATFEGSVEIVPFLRVPGFIQARVTEDSHASKGFPDVSSCQAIALTLRTNASSPYEGYRFSFGNAHAPGGKHFAYGYKTTLKRIPVEDFEEVVIPWDAFTDFWDDATGDPIHSCHDNPLYCPDQETLRSMKTMAIWAEGVAGPVFLEIKSIQAVQCSGMPSEGGTGSTEPSEGDVWSRTMLRGWATQSAPPMRLAGWIANVLGVE